MFDRKAYSKQYRANHKAEIADYSKWWRANHKVENDKYNKQWRIEHKVEIADYQRQRRQTYPLFRVWDGMKQRCSNPNAPKYKNYGGRGIAVCEEWLNYKTFEEWALANDYQKGLSIDRIDNDDGYYPENCHFITIGENAKRRWL